ncbi:glycosyltransferase [Vibrio parahaemolyticus]|uniref:glycosyltransferase n=1 Tax=Vibrio parahaemolyticus TaxID=670 RepID=UPI0007A08368|nr:glycosyltransferase [Vibrio parahaemolyticus]EGR1141524.1 glycosyltransferase [Vibrio parahaemolyticus]ELB1647694.1 glycosyltransferase [Vibrio parahaemolyticus]KYY50743.1 glycosyl transferase [Vibrio parahaemolyticus]
MTNELSRKEGGYGITDGRIAVIMSVYKSDMVSDFMNAVQSILNQTLTCDLYLYRDGIVSPELQVELDNLKLHKNVYYFSSEINNGLAHALNFLIDEVLEKDYNYIARMDSDDISYHNRIELQYEYFESNPEVDVLGTYCREFGSTFSLEKKILPTEHLKLLDFSIARCPFIHPTVMFRTNVFKSGERYPTNTKYTEDMALWFKLLASGFKFANLPLVLLDYYISEETIIRRKGFAKAVSEIKLRLKYMFKLRRVNPTNAFMIFSRLLFHVFPAGFIKTLYRHFR